METKLFFQPGQLVKIFEGNDEPECIGMVLHKEEISFIFSDRYVVLVKDQIWHYRAYELQALDMEK